jgi:hypothetical protein
MVLICLLLVNCSSLTKKDDMRWVTLDDIARSLCLKTDAWEKRFWLIQSIRRKNGGRYLFLTEKRTYQFLLEKIIFY